MTIDPDAVAVKYSQLVHTAAVRRLDGMERQRLDMYAVWLGRSLPQIEADIGSISGNPQPCMCDVCRLAERERADVLEVIE